MNSKKPIVINFFGEPSSGKSCAASYVFYQLKKQGYNIEYLQEFAKKKLYENNTMAFACEPYIFAKQLYDLETLTNSVDVVVTDSPILLPCVYENDLRAKVILMQMEMFYFDKFNNINFFLIRDHSYQTQGRFQTESEANQKNNEIINMLRDNNVFFTSVLASKVDETFIENLKQKIDKSL